VYTYPWRPVPSDPLADGASGKSERRIRCIADPARAIYPARSVALRPRSTLKGGTNSMKTTLKVH
jgi:hypothetical protein